MPIHNIVNENPKLINPTIVPKPAKGTEPNNHTIDIPKIVRRDPKLRINPKLATQTSGFEECEKILLVAC